jgi:phage terminase small subunit
MATRPFRKPNSTLTPRQDAFAREYLADLNIAAAARRAGISARYGIELLSKPHVLARIEELQAERNRRVQVDADWVLKRLVEELTADVNDILNPDGSVKPVCDWPKIWRTGLVSGIRINELYEFDRTGKQGVIGHMKDLQFSDRIKRIELLGRHIAIGAFRDKVAVSTDDPLKKLYAQIQGQAIRPAVEHQHQPDAETEGDG